MATKTVQISECDRCGKDNATTWRITGPEGATREIELCDRHGAPVANAFALGRAVRAPAPPRTPSIPRRRRPDPAPPPPADPPPPTPSAPPAEEPAWR